MNFTRLFSGTIAFLGFFLIVGCGKQGVHQTPLQKAQSVYDVALNRYYLELEILKNEAHLNREKVVEQIIESMCSKCYKQGHGALLHRGYDLITGDIDALRVQVKKLSKNKKLQPLGVQEATKLIQQINNLTDRLQDIRLILTSNKEFREETRYLNQLNAQAAPIVLFPYI